MQTTAVTLSTMVTCGEVPIPPLAGERPVADLFPQLLVTLLSSENSVAPERNQPTATALELTSVPDSDLPSDDLPSDIVPSLAEQAQILACQVILPPPAILKPVGASGEDGNVFDDPDDSLAQPIVASACVRANTQASKPSRVISGDLPLPPTPEAVAPAATNVTPAMPLPLAMAQAEVAANAAQATAVLPTPRELTIDPGETATEPEPLRQTELFSRSPAVNVDSPDPVPAGVMEYGKSEPAFTSVFDRIHVETESQRPPVRTDHAASQVTFRPSSTNQQVRTAYEPMVATMGQPEQVADLDPTGMPEPAKAVVPVAPAELAEQLVSHARLLARGNGGEAVLQLRPEHLGHLHVSMQVENGLISLHLTTETATACQAILERLPDLVTALTAAGMTLAQANVTVGDQPRQRSSWSPDSRSFGKERPEEADSSLSSLPWLVPISMLDVSA
ncbi:MAG: flagellar hook-length control protein FliK [Anaerolineae bacterium]